MKQWHLPDLIKEENDQNLFRLITDQVKKLILSTNIEYVASSCIGKIGSPVVYEMDVKAENMKNYKINYDTHDYNHIYRYSFIVSRQNKIQKSKIIIFDIPEVNAVQS